MDYDYDNAGRVTKILNSQAGGALLSQFDYTYDDNGNCTQQIETQNGFTADRVVTTDYVYDDLNRLESFTHTTTDNGTATGVEQHSYTFYPSYDRKTETVVKDDVTQTQRTYTYDETYWVETIEEAAPGKAGTITYAYDANGNTQTKTNTTGDGPASSVFTYNNRNQLKTVAAGNTGSEVGQGQYHYNYAGMRIRHLGSARGNIEYVYDDKSIIDELVSGTTTPVAHYRYGDRLLSLETSGAEQFYHYASLGTTANLTDTSGQNQVAYRVDPYGEITKQEGESVNRQVFTGHEHDTETGLIYMKARFYDPDIGRFLTQDTYLGEHGTPPSLHRYLYAYGNPTVWWDPTGHSSIMIGDPGMQMYLHEMMPDGRAKDLAQAQFELEQRAMAPMTAGIAVQTTKDAISGVVGGFAYLGDYLLSPYSEKHSDSFKKKTSGFTSGVKAIYDSNGGVIADGLVQSINAGAAELEAGNYYAAGEKSASAAQMQMGVAAAPWAIRSSAAMAANGVKTGINKASSIDWKFLTSEKKPDGGGQGNDIGNSAGEPKSEYVFRADRRTPEQIKKEGGFRAKNPEANVPLEDYVNTGKKSQYVSTTRDPFAAEAHVKNELETEAYIYKIKNNGKGRDVNKELPANTYADESEVVFDFIDACDIVCSQKVRADGLPIEPPVPFN